MRERIAALSGGLARYATQSGRLWAVEHYWGVSLYRARNERGAIRKARREFGRVGAPYSASCEYEDVDWVIGMGCPVPE